MSKPQANLAVWKQLAGNFIILAIVGLGYYLTWPKPIERISSLKI